MYYTEILEEQVLWLEYGMNSYGVKMAYLPSKPNLIFLWCGIWCNCKSCPNHALPSYLGLLLLERTLWLTGQCYSLVYIQAPPYACGKEWGHCYTMHYHLLIDSVVILLPSCNFWAQKACIVNEQFCWCMYWVCVEHLRSVVVPYSGKPSREKIFTNISILVPSVSFLHNILGIPHPYQGFI